MVMKRKIIYKEEQVFDTYIQGVEYAEGLAKRYDNYDLTIEATKRGVWIVFEAYVWETNSDRWAP